jgi:glycosyltransferase involved in cell wall biosynthesis
MPLALLEAMAVGVPLVATRVGGVSEIVKDGETGLLVPPRDSHALAEGIITLLEDGACAKQLGDTAREVAASRYSLTRMVETYQEIYAGLTGEPKHEGVRG